MNSRISIVFLFFLGSLGANGQNNILPSSGNVGIGTTNPLTALEVSGDQYTNRISQSGATYIEILQRTWSGGGGILFSAYGADEFLDGSLPKVGNTKNKFNANVLGSTNHGPGMIYYGGNGGVMNFYIGPVSSGEDTDVVWGEPVLNLNRTGKVGIGVTNPSQKLEVNGTVKAKEVNVTTSGWADYVFNPDYDLMPLSELADFVHQNGHLPDVPTETEVLENGVNLAEMNVKLLEKVEELTLYILSLEKRINGIEEIHKIKE